MPKKQNKYLLPIYSTSLRVGAATLAMLLSLFSFDVFNKDGLVDDPRLSIIAAIMGALVAALTALAALQTRRRQQQIDKIKRAFIIYSSEDSDLLESLLPTFNDAEIEPWIDREQIVAGDVWQDTIRNAINESSMAIVLITENFKENTFAYNELNNAIKTMHSTDKSTSPIIPLVYDVNHLPSTLRHIQYVDMTRKDAREFLKKSLKIAMERLWSYQNNKSKVHVGD